MRDRFFFEACKRENTNDCLIHALNYALGCPWFTTREQVVRLIFKRRHFSWEEAIDQKVRGGVTPSQLTQFAVVNNQSWSLVELACFKTEEGETYDDMLRFVKANMLEDNPISEMILTCKGQTTFVFGHAGAFVRCLTKTGRPFLKYLDNKNDIELYTPFTPPLLSGSPLDPKEDFGHFIEFRLYAIAKEEVLTRKRNFASRTP